VKGVLTAEDGKVFFASSYWPELTIHGTFANLQLKLLSNAALRVLSFPTTVAASLTIFRQPSAA
jgi:hypothetical protein